MAPETVDNKALAAIEYAQQAERLSFKSRDKSRTPLGRDTAVRANFVTPHDPVIVTAGGGRLPAVSLVEAEKLNILKNKAEGIESSQKEKNELSHDGSVTPGSENPAGEDQLRPSGTLQTSSPPTGTHPLFPPLPLYGPPGK